MNEKYKYLGKNTVIFAISSFSTKFLSFFLMPLYTNLLTKEEYGTADLITTTATLLIFILTINVSDAVLRFSIDIKENQDKILSYGIRILLYGTLWCTLGLGLIYFLNIVQWPVYYYIFVLLSFFSTALYKILTCYMRGIDQIRPVAVSGIISSFTIIMCNILLLLVFKIGIIGYLISMILGPLIASIYCMICIRVPIVTYFKNYCDKQTIKEMKAYCVPLIFNNIALWVNAFLDKYFLTAYCGIGENGIYSVASKIPTILATCYTVFAQAWNLSAIKEFDKNDEDGFFSKTYNVYNALTFIMCSVLVLFNIPLAKFLYAKEFFTAWRYSSILLISVAFNSLTIVIGSIFSAVKKTKVSAGTTVLSAVINTILNIFLIPNFGAIGASIATVSAYIVMWAVRLYYSRKYIKFKMNILRDCLVYLILMLQVTCEHVENHLYLVQICCLFVIVIIYHKYIEVICCTVINMIKNKIKNKA